jgi:tRNA U34 5-carboxymethylaminomethyl modifying enzyme MnmG/GidA
MNAKSLFFTAFGVVLSMVVYFVVNPSSEKSLEAKYYYEIGKYDIAYEKAKEAFALDGYNRMASTVMAQSKIAMKYQAYINQAKGYMEEINAMANQDSLTQKDRAKIKMMSEIVVNQYKKLAPSVMTDEALVKEAQRYYKEFGKLLEKVDTTL